jgi:hypothetical protein
MLSIAVVLVGSRYMRKQTDGTDAKSGSWIDVVGAAAPMIAALVLGVFGLIATQRILESQEERARRVSQQAAARDKAHQQTEQTQLRLNALERFFPQFSTTEQDKRAAILAIRATGDVDLAVTMAGLFPSSGSVAALEAIARHAAPWERSPALTALGGMNTDESVAALTRLFDDVSQSVVPFDGQVPRGERAQKVVAGVTWKARWLLVPLGDLTNAKPRNGLHAEERGRQSYGDGLTRLHLAQGLPSSTSHTSIEFSPNPPERGESVFAIGLDLAGHPSRPRLGLVADVDSDAVRVRFAHEPEQTAGSLLVLPSGMAVGMLSHEQQQTGLYRYIRADSIVSWFDQLEREERERQRRR